MIDTRERILAKALELFNEQGVEYAGMRELAALLNIRVGNITYYFPTKDHLVLSISEQYSALNSQTHADNPVNTLYDFLKKTEMLFKNGLRYRCLLLSMAHLMQQNALIAEKYKETQAIRGSGLKRNIEALIKNKYLKIGTADEEWLLLSANSLVGRFWMAEAAVSGKRHDLENQMGHYLKLLAFLFKPYASKKGLEDIEKFLEEINK